MKVLRILCIGAIAIGLTPFALADKYDDLAAKGYCWVTVDGPYAYFSRDDLRQFAKQRGKEFELIEQLRAYYLIPGTVARVIQKDAASGMSQIQLDGVRRPLWTLSRFLSVRPITDLDGKIETPFEPNTTSNNGIGTGTTSSQRKSQS
jgi:hypothetical protein